MTVFDLLNNSQNESQRSGSDHVEEAAASQTVGDKIKKYSDFDLSYEDIAMPEMEVTVYFVDKDEKLGEVNTVMKTKQVLRYQHLARSFIDDKDYSPNCTYFLFSCGKVWRFLLRISIDFQF